jgi:hypothetical protein
MKQCSSVRLRIHSKFLERLSILQRFWAYPTTPRQKVWMVYPPVIQHNYRKRPMYGWSTYLKNHKWWFSIVMVQIGRGYHDSSTSPIIWLRNSSRSSTLLLSYGHMDTPIAQLTGFPGSGLRRMNSPSVHSWRPPWRCHAGCRWRSRDIPTGLRNGCLFFNDFMANHEKLWLMGFNRMWALSSQITFWQSSSVHWKSTIFNLQIIYESTFTGCEVRLPEGNLKAS